MSIVAHVGTFPNAIHIVCDGVEKAVKEGNFKLTLVSFGHVKDTICHGCAAICALHFIAEKPFDPRNFEQGSYVNRAEYLGFGVREMDKFEWVVDSLVCGLLEPLFVFFGVGDRWDKDAHDYKWEKMTDQNYLEIIPIMRECANRWENQND